MDIAGPPAGFSFDDAQKHCPSALRDGSVCRPESTFRGELLPVVHAALGTTEKEAFGSSPLSASPSSSCIFTEQGPGPGCPATSAPVVPACSSLPDGVLPLLCVGVWSVSPARMGAPRGQELLVRCLVHGGHPVHVYCREKKGRGYFF